MGYSGNGVGSNGVGGNGHANGHTPNGSTGGALGGLAPKPPKIREYLRRCIENGIVAEEDMSHAIELARDIVSGEHKGKYTVREQLRAMEFIDSVTSRRMIAAVDLDKMDRLDRGDSTENFAHYSVAIPEARSRITE